MTAGGQEKEWGDPSRHSASIHSMTREQITTEEMIMDRSRWRRRALKGKHNPRGKRAQETICIAVLSRGLCYGHWCKNGLFLKSRDPYMSWLSLCTQRFVL